VSTLKRNIFSNLAGGAWVAVLTLAITPIQINLLGVEAFGLIVKWGIEGAAVAYMGLTPDIADTSEKADNGRGGVSCQKEENTRRSSNVKQLPWRISQA
jgi:hypothetical protein